MTVRRLDDARTARVLLAPALLALAVLAAWPGLWVLWLSLQRRIPVFGIERFVGPAHYAFLAEDPRFWNAVQVTLIFTFVSVSLEFLLGLGVALGLQGQRRGRPSRCCCCRGRCPRSSRDACSSGSITRRRAC